MWLIFFVSIFLYGDWMCRLNLFIGFFEISYKITVANFSFIFQMGNEIDSSLLLPVIRSCFSPFLV